MLPAFRLLAKFKFLRGTPFDIFGYSEERRTERKLIADYEALLGEIMAKLTPENHHIAVGLASIPEKIRGFGHVKARHLVAAKADEAALLDQFRSGQAPAAQGGGVAPPTSPASSPRPPARRRASLVELLLGRHLRFADARPTCARTSGSASGMCAGRGTTREPTARARRRNTRRRYPPASWRDAERAGLADV